MKYRKIEAGFSLSGFATGAIIGAKKGAHIGYSKGGYKGAKVATIPGAIIGGALGLLSANKVGSEIDRHKEKLDNTFNF
ncbi:hypothetical protein A1D15_0528 [Lactiplantibacillus plantarum]|uniref:hypothetical protein n=1 Tax=Lactiplantibacillus plantarum TaxID=1590 RepID=UPI0007B54DD7|nr:hypothetical protein [Lactiplantibacillus plantarum]KZU96525.1 hypothetical protein A1D15_0528 [Lactiplantibacillus plantarum]